MSSIMQFNQQQSKQTMPLSAEYDELTKSKNNQVLVALLSQCQLDDQQAFNQLYQQTAARLNGIAYRITRNVDSANEVLQEAFIQIWQHRKNYQADKGEAFTWLASIVRYRAYDRLRYDKRRHQQDTVEFNEMDFNALDLAEINRHSAQLGLADFPEQALNNCLAQLEQKQSQCILMAYLYGYSRQEISVYFNSPLSTIKSWIRRGLGRLLLCLSR